MGWNLQTRSRNRDYRFLGSSPERWWTQWSRDTSFERPTLLVEGGKKGWRLLASGIPSKRHDGHHTRIRYTLVGAGAPGEGVEEAEKLVATWLEDSAHLFTGGSPPESHGLLSRALDSHLTEDSIETWFETTTSPEELQDDIGSLCARALAGLKADRGRTPANEPESWYGGVQSARCRAAFVRRARTLFRGEEEGGAYLLNLIEHPNDLGAPPGLAKVVLLFDLPVGRVESPRSWQRAELGASKKKTSSPIQRRVPSGRRRAQAQRDAP